MFISSTMTTTTLLNCAQIFWVFGNTSSIGSLAWKATTFFWTPSGEHLHWIQAEMVIDQSLVTSWIVMSQGRRRRLVVSPLLYSGAAGRAAGYSIGMHFIIQINRRNSISNLPNVVA